MSEYSRECWGSALTEWSDLLYMESWSEEDQERAVDNRNEAWAAKTLADGMATKGSPHDTISGEDMEAYLRAAAAEARAQAVAKCGEGAWDAAETALRFARGCEGLVESMEVLDEYAEGYWRSEEAAE